MTSFVRLITALLAFAGFTSCGGAAAAADWQTLELPGVGTLRVRHAHRLTPADTAGATAAAQTLVDWTKANAWDRLRVMVDDKHPIVVSLKAGDHLMLTPADGSLPVIWLSLAKGHRTLLEDRSTGRLSAFELPPGKSLDLKWLGL